MPTSISLTLDASSVKGPLVTTLCDSLDRLLAAAPAGDSARSLETAVWSMLLDVGRGALDWRLGADLAVTGRRLRAAA